MNTNKIIEILRIINLIPTAVLAVESIIKGSGRGSEKALNVQARIMTALETSEFITDRDIVDDKKFRRGLKKISDGIVDVLNSSLWAKRQS